MIILLAMTNSLAARENSQRGPIGPPDRAARGVYAGDGGIRKSDNRRPRIRRRLSRDSAAIVRPRRPNGGRKMVDLPSGHRQPENNTWLTRHHSSGAARRPCHDPSHAAGLCPGRSIPGFCLQSPQTDALARASRVASDPMGRQPALALFARPTGHRTMVPANASLYQRASRPREPGPNS
jgi:hypothetical protein